MSKTVKIFVLVGTEEVFRDEADDEVAAIVLQIERNPEMLKDESYATLYEEYQSNHPEIYAKPDKTAKPDKISDNKSGKQEDAKPDKSDKQDKPEDEDEDVIGKKPVMSRKVKSDTIEIEDLDAGLVPIFEQVTGMDLSKKENIKKLIPQIEEWKRDAADKAKSKEDFDNIINELSALPAPLAKALVAYSKGDDYIQVLKRTFDDVDYSKDASSIPEEKLIRKYFDSEDVTDEDLLEPTIKNKYLKNAKVLFEKDKQVIKQQADEQITNAQRIKKERDSDISRTIEKFRQEWETGEDANKRKAIKEHLESMPVNRLTHDSKGRLKVDAAEIVGFALYGKDELDVKTTKAKKQAAQEALKDNVAQRSDTINTRAGNRIPRREEEEAVLKEHKKLYDAVDGKSVYD